MSNLPSIPYTERERAQIRGRLVALESAGPGGGGPTAWGDITGTLASQSDLQTALNGKASSAQGALADSALQPGDPLPWADITGEPVSFPPSAHTHPIADVTGLQTALDGKQASGSYAAASHTHATSEVTGLDTALAGKQATLVSGTSIKTVNGNSLLGPGDLVISGGGGGGSSPLIGWFV